MIPNMTLRTPVHALISAEISLERVATNLTLLPRHCRGNSNEADEPAGQV